jgi:NTE family protein
MSMSNGILVSGSFFRSGFARAALLVLMALSSGCAFSNRELAADQLSNPRHGHRIDKLLSPDRMARDKTLVLLAFSGGGTRASAFSYGVLCALSQTAITYHGESKRMLDLVDVISSTSGGSFTSAYYGLFRDEIFRDFRDRFLVKNVQGALAGNLLWPSYAIRVFNPWIDFSRIDMAAEVYDKMLFGGRTFKDFPQDRGPFIILNSTNMGMESHFEFTQEQFDLLGSDLDSYPVARAVAASSAFPGLLSPLTLRNFGLTIPAKPDWVTQAEDDWTFKKGGSYLKAALDWNDYQDKTAHPWIHLLDGGLTDNLGLRALENLFFDANDPGAIPRLTQVRHLIVISVDSATDSQSDLDKKRKTPGLVRSIAATIGVVLDSYTRINRRDAGL